MWMWMRCRWKDEEGEWREFCERYDSRTGSTHDEELDCWAGLGGGVWGGVGRCGMGQIKDSIFLKINRLSTTFIQLVHVGSVMLPLWTGPASSTNPARPTDTIHSVMLDENLSITTVRMKRHTKRECIYVYFIGLMEKRIASATA